MSHKSEAKYSNITKDRLIYNKTGHFAILVNRRGVCKIFENGGVQLLGLIIYDDGGGGGGAHSDSFSISNVHVFILLLGGEGPAGGRGSSFTPNVLNSLDIIKKRKASGLIAHFQGWI